MKVNTFPVKYRLAGLILLVLTIIFITASTAGAFQSSIADISITADKNSTQPTGITVRWTVTAIGLDNLTYAFYLYKDSELVHTQWFHERNHLTYTLSQPGSYHVRFAVRASNDAVASGNSDILVVENIPLEILSVLPDSQSPQLTGTKVRWTTSTQGPPGLEYAFHIYHNSELVHTRQYRPQRYIDHTPAEPGEYMVRVFVRTPQGETAHMDSEPFLIEAAPPEILSLSTDKKSPQGTGNAVRWTVNARGSSGLQFAFYIYRGTDLIHTQWYGDQNYVSYAPGEPGEYRVRAYVRNRDSTAVFRDSEKFVFDIAPQIQSILSNMPSPQRSGATVRWTTLATGPPGMEYAFHVYLGPVLVHNKPYSAQNYIDYSTAHAGSYRVRVFVKTAVGIVSSIYSDYFTFDNQLTYEIPVSIFQDFIPVGRNNRPGHYMNPLYITIHDTGNTSPGSNARMHALYIKSDACADRPASWHFTVDSVDIFQHLPLNENGWHAGDGEEGPGNRQSIGIEICENSDGIRARAEINAAWLTAKLLLEHNLPLSSVRQHSHWDSRTNCPRVLRARQGGWEAFLADVQQKMTLLQTGTQILGSPGATVAQAQRWAQARGAHSRFINIAPTYWQYGAATGIRPEVLYAQSAKETAFGNYGGAVTPDQNNWAGIKTVNATGDEREDHESFPTPTEGVRAHFNHMCAYTGLAPSGQPHGRYYLVLTIPWAGTIRYVEELGGRWAPDPGYGNSIVSHYLNGLLATP